MREKYRKDKRRNSQGETFRFVPTKHLFRAHDISVSWAPNQNFMLMKSKHHHYLVNATYRDSSIISSYIAE